MLFSTENLLRKGAVMQIEKAQIRIAYVFQKYPKNFALQLYIVL